MSIFIKLCFKFIFLVLYVFIYYAYKRHNFVRMSKCIDIVATLFRIEVGSISLFISTVASCLYLLKKNISEMPSYNIDGNFWKLMQLPINRLYFSVSYYSVDNTAGFMKRGYTLFYLYCFHAAGKILKSN